MWTVPTAPSTTSTTLPPDPCARPCADDGDACTDEQCDPTTGCRSVPKLGIEGLQCFARSAESAAVSCSLGEITPSTAKFTTRTLRQAVRQIARAESTSGSAQKKRLKKAAGLLRQLEKKLAKAVTKGQVQGTCAEALHAALGRTQARIATLLQ
jgi:hypothetical protein